MYYFHECTKIYKSKVYYIKSGRSLYYIIYCIVYYELNNVKKKKN